MAALLGSPLKLVREGNPSAPETSASKRVDNRPLREIRTVSMRTGVVAKAAGSACVELQGTKVICSVFGPHQSDGKEYLSRGQLECSLRFTTFSQRKRRTRVAGGSPEERELSQAMAAALSASVQLNQYPKSLIAVHALVLQDDGGALAAAITCASLALANASVLLYDMVASCTCAISNEVVALDYCSSEASDATGQLLVAHMSSLDQLTLLRQEGAVEQGRVIEAMQLALEGCTQMHARMRDTLLEQKGQSVGKKGTETGEKKRKRGIEEPATTPAN